MRATILPVVLGFKQHLLAISRELARLDMSFSKIQNTMDDIRIHLVTITDYREIIRFLGSDGHEYHTYDL